MAKFATMFAGGAALLLVGVTTPAFAANDPSATKRQGGTTAAATPAPLNAKARKMVWCVTDKADPEGKKVCKTREKWIAEGKDPFGKY